MTPSDPPPKMVMRLFHARAKPGCAADLLKKFATTSTTVVEHEPGNKGYVFGRGVSADDDVVVFASFWEDLNAIRTRFGSDWQVSFLPEGYGDLIEECWVQHIDVGSGWFVQASHQT